MKKILGFGLLMLGMAACDARHDVKSVSTIETAPSKSDLIRIDDAFQKASVLEFIQTEGTTREPLVQKQVIGGAMAAYNAMIMGEALFRQNEVIIAQNEKIMDKLGIKRSGKAAAVILIKKTR